MKYFMILLFSLLSSPSYADCYVQCPVNDNNIIAYHNADHFQWTNYDDDLHLALGFGGAIVIATALEHYGGLPAWESGLIGGITMTLFGVSKEVLFDTYTSRTDIKTWAAGGLSGGLTFMVLNF